MYQIQFVISNYASGTYRGRELSHESQAPFWEMYMDSLLDMGKKNSVRLRNLQLRMFDDCQYVIFSSACPSSRSPYCSNSGPIEINEVVNMAPLPMEYDTDSEEEYMPQVILHGTQRTIIYPLSY